MFGARYFLAKYFAADGITLRVAPVAGDRSLFDNRTFGSSYFASPYFRRPASDDGEVVVLLWILPARDVATWIEPGRDATGWTRIARET